MKIAASSVEDCGTVLCMFGILCAMGGDVFGLTRDDDPDKSVAGLMINMALGDYSEHLELMALFMPGNISVAGLDDITVAQAARQLRLYLTTGTHEWVSDVAPAEL